MNELLWSILYAGTKLLHTARLNFEPNKLKNVQTQHMHIGTYLVAVHFEMAAIQPGLEHGTLLVEWFHFIQVD